MRLLAQFLSLTAGVCLAADPPKEVSGKVVAIADGDTITVLDAEKLVAAVGLDNLRGSDKTTEKAEKQAESGVLSEPLKTAARGVEVWRTHLGIEMGGGDTE